MRGVPKPAAGRRSSLRKSDPKALCRSRRGWQNAPFGKNGARRSEMTARSGGALLIRPSRYLQAGLWILILGIAFFMQVVPVLMILTMVGLAFGATSGVALVLVPVVAFGMLSVACWIATQRTKNWAAKHMEHMDRQIYISPYPKDGHVKDSRGVHHGLIPHLKRLRWRYY
jgi:hypothetical protein